MLRRTLALALTLGILTTGTISAAEVSSAADHACCRTMEATEAGAHEGCSTPATRMSCCAPAPARDTDQQIPPAGSATSSAPSFTALKGFAAHVPGLADLACASAACSFTSARLTLPPDPVYLRNLVLLV